MTELPTKEQSKTLIAFMQASDKCKYVRGVSKGTTNRALCTGIEFKKLLPEVRRWAKDNPEEFEKLHKKIGIKTREPK